VKLLLENLPPSLADQRETLARCIEARPDSDVDLCLVADGAERQLAAAARYRGAMWPVHPGLSFTLVPITPGRLEEKKSCGDFFFNTVFEEGVQLAAED